MVMVALSAAGVCTSFEMATGAIGLCDRMKITDNGHAIETLECMGVT